MKIALAASAAAVASGALARYYVDAATTQKFNAVALDGSPAAFYYQAGTGADANNWAIYFEGGGWCYSLEDCYERSKTPLGSSKNIPATQGLGGLLSSDCSKSPLCNYNMVYIKYLDGNSFSGMLDKPVIYNNGTANIPIYFRGRAIIDAVIDSLKRNVMGSPNNIANANHIVETGCSAGGLATFLHADYVASQLPHTGQYFSVPISGYFLNHLSVDNQYVYGEQIRSIYALSNASTNAACQQFYATTGDDWRCNMAQYVYPFIQSNVFVLNSKFDSWQTACIMTSEPVVDHSKNGNCSAAAGWGQCAGKIASCSQTQITDVVNPYGDYLQQSFLNANKAKSLAPGNGGFVHSCHTHCEAQSDDFVTFKIGTSTMRDAFAAWYTANINSGGKAPAAAS